MNAPARPPALQAVLEVRTIGLRFGDLFRDPTDGTASVVKSLAVSSWIVVTGILIWEAYYHSISALDLLMYAMTTTVCSGAPLASTVISLVQPRLAGMTGKYGVGKNGNGDTGVGGDTVTATASVATTPKV